MQAGEGVAVARAIAEPGGDQGRRQHRLFQRVTGPGRIGDQEHRAVQVDDIAAASTEINQALDVLASPLQVIKSEPATGALPAGVH